MGITNCGDFLRKSRRLAPTAFIVQPPCGVSEFFRVFGHGCSPPSAWAIADKPLRHRFIRLQMPDNLLLFLFSQPGHEGSIIFPVLRVVLRRRLDGLLAINSNNSSGPIQHMVVRHHCQIVVSCVHNSVRLHLLRFPIIGSPKDQNTTRFYGLYVSHPLQELNAVGFSLDLVNVLGGLSYGFG